MYQAHEPPFMETLLGIKAFVLLKNSWKASSTEVKPNSTEPQATGLIIRESINAIVDILGLFFAVQSRRKAEFNIHSIKIKNFVKIQLSNFDWDQKLRNYTLKLGRFTITGYYKLDLKTTSTESLCPLLEEFM